MEIPVWLPEVQLNIVLFACRFQNCYRFQSRKCNICSWWQLCYDTEVVRMKGQHDKHITPFCSKDIGSANRQQCFITRTSNCYLRWLVDTSSCCVHRVGERVWITHGTIIGRIRKDKMASVDVVSSSQHSCVTLSFCKSSIPWVALVQFSLWILESSFFCEGIANILLWLKADTPPLPLRSPSV